MGPAAAVCPQCQAEMDIPRNLRGGEIECPQCEHAFTPLEELPEPDPAKDGGVARCPQCELEMDVGPELVGLEVECPGCRLAFKPEVYAAAPRRRRRWNRFEDDDDFDPVLLTKLTEQRLRPAAIALLSCAIVRVIATGALSIAGGSGLFNRGAGVSDAVWFVVTAVILFKESLTAYGAWQMLNARSYGWGLAAGILLLIPTVDVACCLVPWLIFLGFGIWALVVINDTDVRWLIRQRQKQEHRMDPADG